MIKKDNQQKANQKSPKCNQTNQTVHQKTLNVDQTTPNIDQKSQKVDNIVSDDTFKKLGQVNNERRSIGQRSMKQTVSSKYAKGEKSINTKQ